jgi:hypothetical protein
VKAGVDAQTPLLSISTGSGTETKLSMSEPHNDADAVSRSVLSPPKLDDAREDTFLANKQVVTKSLCKTLHSDTNTSAVLDS